jgi:hypothetical protein
MAERRFRILRYGETGRPSRTQSADAWRQYFYDDRRLLTNMRETGLDGHEYKSSSWIEGKEIRIYTMPGIRLPVIAQVIAGIRDRLEETRLEFTILNHGNDQEALAHIRQASTPQKLIDHEILKKMALVDRSRKPVYGGKQHANVYITDKHAVFGQQHWGAAQFRGGMMALFLPGERQYNLPFIRNVAKHETTHLVGLDEHHDAVSSVPGYGQEQNCNMLWHCSTLHTCQRCNDAVKSFWQGIEARTGDRYLR